MATTTAPRTVTLEEWLTMPKEKDGVEEVVDGIIVSMPPTHFPHALIVENLIDLIKPQLDKSKVHVLGSSFALVIGEDPLTARSPDLALYWKDRFEVRQGVAVSPPGLIIEVLSPSENRRRKESKLIDYATIGVPEVWLVSPEAQSVEVRLLEEGKFVTKQVCVEGSVSPTQFPTVSIDIQTLWP
jgi:Uma2 family endonuclease